MTVETLAKQIFAECEKDREPVTIEEAEEMARMELGAKSISNYTRSIEPTKEKDKKTRVSKVSDEKKLLFDEIWADLSGVFGGNASILTENKLICVKIGEKSFKIDVTETRVKK